MQVKCSVFIATSLDGFIARRDGDISWLGNPDEALPGEDYGYKDFIASVDTLVMGRNTYETVLGFNEWPYSGKRVVVLSSGSPPVPAHLVERVEILAGTPTELVQRISQNGACHIYVDGGKTIQGFLRAGLIHTMTITRLPILLGDGIPLFGALDEDIRLRHIQTKTYPNGFVQSQYALRQKVDRLKL